MQQHQRANLQHAALERRGWFTAAKKSPPHSRWKYENRKIERTQRKSVGEWHIPDWTTAWVCSEVPEAILVRAQAASNWREGLQDTERETWMKQSKTSHDSCVVSWLPVISVQAFHQFRKDARFDEIINRGVTVTWQQLPRKASTSLITYLATHNLNHYFNLLYFMFNLYFL